MLQEMYADNLERAEFAIDLARRAGELALTHFRSLDSLKIESKGHQDLVSQADREVEAFVRAELAAHYRQDAIVGEEEGTAEGTTGYAWVIDPIDGTANFVSGIPAWAVVIACAKHGVTIAGVVHEPCTGETFHAVRGGGAFLNGRPIRASGGTTLSVGSLGIGFSNRREAANVAPLVGDLLARGGVFFRNASGALMLAYVAAGRLLGYVEEHMNAWDCVAGLLMIEEAGGRIRTPDPETVLRDGTMVIAGGAGVYGEIEALCRPHFSR